LPANFADLPPRYLRTPEAARFVGLSIRTLEKHRIYGTGPRYSTRMAMSFILKSIGAVRWSWRG